MKQSVFAQRLRDALDASGMSQAALSRTTGIDSASISLYLKGDYQPRANKLMLLATALEVTPEWLSGAVESRAQPESVVSLPMVIGAEKGKPVFGPDTFSVPRGSLEGVSPQRFFALKITGMAMHPQMPEGDVLLVRRGNAQENNAVLVIARDNELLVRRFRATPAGGILLPANPEFAPRTLTSAMKVLGRGVLLVRRL